MHTRTVRCSRATRAASPLAALAAAALAAGCNVSTEGATGEILFTPDECGRIGGCDFTDSIGVGGAIQVHLQSTRGEPVTGFDLVSDDEAVLSVTPLGVVEGLLTFGVVGESAGVARLVVVDGEGLEVDFLEVGVQDVTALRLDPFIGADGLDGGPVVDDTFDEVWTMAAEQDVSFFVTPLIGDDVPTMGTYEYVVTSTTPEIFDLLDGSAEPEQGSVRMTLPPGQYDLTFESPFAPPLVVLFDVQ